MQIYSWCGKISRYFWLPNTVFNQLAIISVWFEKLSEMKHDPMQNNTAIQKIYCQLLKNL